ncbi:MAG: hypothetical protein QM676_03925 [Novosphingobium sp.]
MAITSSPSGPQPARQPVPPLGAMGRRWSALHQAANVVAMLAGLPGVPLPAEVHDFPAAIHAAGGWRLSLAEQGLADLTAVMEPGLAALLALHQRGADPAAPARALWEEFHAARVALLALVPPPEGLRELSLG